ncbi:MAG TPA: hypothetical protein ACHBX0_02300 [Arsenophonus sp.]
MEKIYIPAKEYNNNSFKHHNVSISVYDYALNIWQDLRVKINGDDTQKDDRIVQSKKDIGPIILKIFTIHDGKSASFHFSFNAEYNHNGNDLIIGSYTSIKNKDTGKVEIIDFKYNINSGLNLDLSPLFEGSNENPNWDFLMTLTEC